MKLRFAREGWVFVLPLVIVAALALLIQWYVAAILFSALAAFVLSFFRDPQRKGSERHVDVLSPADGTVVAIKDVEDGAVWQGLTRQVSIFMSMFDVYVNRAPISGRIVHYRYIPGGTSGADENLIVIADGHGATIGIKQIAGLLARRIVFDKKEGDEIVRGERIGMIKFGSRVDVFFPPKARLLVSARDKVKVGLTVIAEIEE